MEEVGGGGLDCCGLVGGCVWEGVGDSGGRFEDSVDGDGVVPGVCRTVEVVETVIPEDVGEAETVGFFDEVVVAGGFVSWVGKWIWK